MAPKARERLLAIATRHFAQNGFERASLNEIVAEAGISKGAYYYYFDDKDDLFATALENAVDAWLARLPLPALDTLTEEEFWPTVERFVVSWGALLDGSSDLFRAAMQVSEAQRKSPRFAPMLAKGARIYRALIVPGQRLGCVRSDLSVDALVRLLEVNDALLDSLFLSSHKKKGGKQAIAAHFRLLFDTFKRLLVAEPFAPPPRDARRRGKHA